jgi:competence protein ComEA
VPLPARRSDDADVIRARLRRLLADARQAPGWIPGDDPPSSGGGAHGFELVGVRPDDAPADDITADDTPADDAPPDDVPAGEQSDDWRSREFLPPGAGRHRSPGAVPRWSPGVRGARSLWLAGVGAALALVVWTWLDRPQVQPAPEPAPAPMSAPSSTARSAAMPVGETSEVSPTVVVSVVGLVARPGLVTLPVGSRVADAVEAAGGLLPEADAATINQAALVSDGEQIAVGVPGAPPAAPASTSGGSGGPVDLNTATVAELDALPGIGPVLAQRIVEHRTTVGPFTSAEELDDVPGIGPSIAAELAALVSV